MEIRHLNTLVTVAETHSFAEAAEQLFITPAAVSQQIRQLEEELGLQLFDRTLRPPRLNTNGAGLIERAKELVKQFNDFQSSASEGTIHGRLSIGAISGITATLLPETLRSLRRRYPEVRVRIEEGQSQVLVQRVRREELDAAIVTDVAELPDTMEQISIFSEPLVVLADHSGNPQSWREALENHYFLRPNRNAGVGTLVDKSLKHFHVHVDEAMELDSTDSIVQMALAGLGSAVVPLGRVSPEASAKLRIFPFGEPQVHRDVVLVQRKNTEASALSRLLYQALQSQLAERKNLKTARKL